MNKGKEKEDRADDDDASTTSKVPFFGPMRRFLRAVAPPQSPTLRKETVETFVHINNSFLDVVLECALEVHKKRGIPPDPLKGHVLDTQDIRLALHFLQLDKGPLFDVSFPYEKTGDAIQEVNPFLLDYSHTETETDQVTPEPL